MLSLCSKLGSAAIASLTAFASPVQFALGAPPVDQVNVVNPATMPALTSSVDDPGRIPYQKLVLNTGCVGQTICAFTWPQVPQGQRLVIQHISGLLTVSPDPGALLVFFGNVRNEVNVVSAVNIGGSSFSALHEQVLLYFDQGETPMVLAQALGSSTFNTSEEERVFLSGYMIDCTASPCAQIAP